MARSVPDDIRWRGERPGLLRALPGEAFFAAGFTASAVAGGGLDSMLGAGGGGPRSLRIRESARKNMMAAIMAQSEPMLSVPWLSSRKPPTGGATTRVSAAVKTELRMETKGVGSRDHTHRGGESQRPTNLFLRFEVSKRVKCHLGKTILGRSCVSSEKRSTC